MIVVIWQRYLTGSRWWLAVLGAVLLLDVLVGSWLLAWEIDTLRASW